MFPNLSEFSKLNLIFLVKYNLMPLRSILQSQKIFASFLHQNRLQKDNYTQKV